MDQVMGAFTVWVITWRTAWPFFLSAAGFLVLAACAARTVGLLPPPESFLMMLLPPFLVGAWGGANWALDEHLAGPGWRSWVLLALGLGSALIPVYALWRYRRAPAYWLVILCAINTFVLDLAFVFVGDMAIMNDWL